MNLKFLSNAELHQRTKNTADKERQTTLELLWHLRENEKRMLFAKMGYRDLKEYCIKELKVSEGSAWRRISAMRLLQELPEVEAKIQSGDLNLTQIAMARTHFREVKATSAQKQELLQSIENQSTRTTERLLAENKPTDTLIKPEVIEKPLRGQRLEVTLVLDKSLQDVLSEIQILLGKPYSKLELLNMLATEKLQAMKKDSKSQERNAQPAPDEMNRTRYIPTTNIREVKVRDGHQCQFVDSLTGRKCSARFHLQVDHVKPFAKGGDSSLKNLRILCVNHNKLHAIRQFGLAKMKTYLPQLN